jgi:hypothetical protein
MWRLAFYLHDHIISIRGEVWAHKTNLTIIEVPVPIYIKYNAYAWGVTWNFIHLYCMGDNSVFPQLLCYQILCIMLSNIVYLKLS